MAWRRKRLGISGRDAAAARGLALRPRPRARRGGAAARRDPRGRVHRADPRHRARRQRRGDPRRRPGAHHRLPDHRGEHHLAHHQQGRGGRRLPARLRPGDRLRPGAAARQARRDAARARQRGLVPRRRERGGRRPRRARARAQGHGVRQARVRRLLGVRARRGDVHRAGASAVGRRGADRRRRQARSASARCWCRRRSTPAPCRATCSCRSTCSSRSSTTC